MEVIVNHFKTEEKRRINLGDRIGEGSNSFIYDVISSANSIPYVAKCSRNCNNYVSFNMQYNSYLGCYMLGEYSIIVPKILLYGQCSGIGDVLIMEKIENLYDLSFIINNSLFYGEIIIKKVAEGIARLHNMGISGYDVEFYWKADINQLVLLDIGPQFTFDINYSDMLSQHLEIEKDNLMGTWNIISQIVPEAEAKEYFNKIKKYDQSRLEEFIDAKTLQLHIMNVAKIHALTIICKLSLHKQKYYLEIFLNEYKKRSETMSINSRLYLREFRNTVENKSTYGEAYLYYSKVKTLCRESCSVQLER